QMKPCPQGTLICDRQPDVHALNLGAMLEAIVDFEIEFEPTSTLEEALSELGSNVIFSRLVRLSVESLNKKKIVGIGSDHNDPNAALHRYNTVSFSLGLNQGNPTNVSLGGVTATPGSLQTAVYSNWVSSETSLGRNGETNQPGIPYYPSASLATIGLYLIS